MKRFFSRAAGLGAAFALCAATPAMGVSTDGYDIPYIGAGAEFVSVDDIRANDDGVGGRFRIGFPINVPHSAIELSIYDNVFERDLDGDDDYQTGFFVDYVYGLQGLLGDTYIKPFVLAGIGAAEDDILGTQSIQVKKNIVNT